MFTGLVIFADIMELIQIIYDTLILGTVLLSIVVLASFVKYKTRRNERSRGNLHPEKLSASETQRLFRARAAVKIPDAHHSFGSFHDGSSSSVPIYRLDQYQTREIKIVRKPTSLPFTDERSTQASSRFTRTNGVSKPGRYRILNEENNSGQNIRIVNFNS